MILWLLLTFTCIGMIHPVQRLTLDLKLGLAPWLVHLVAHWIHIQCSNSKTDVSFIWYQSEKSENEKTKLTKVIAFFPHNFDITTWMTAKVPALLIWNNFSDNVLIHLLFLCFNIKSMRKSAYLNNSNFWIVLVFEYYFAFSMLYSFVLNSYLVSVCSWNFVRFFFVFFFLTKTEFSTLFEDFVSPVETS